MPGRLVFDIETNGFSPSEIFCIGVYDLDQEIYYEYDPESVAEGIMHLASADVVIGHHVLGFDLPVIERLTEGLVVIPKSNVVDTHQMSRRLFPDMNKHKLETWGIILGYPKMVWTKFDAYDPGMLEYMRRDVEINVKLYKFLEQVERENLLEAV